MTLRIGKQYDTSEWIPLRETVEDECPTCGFMGPHSIVMNEDGDMKGQCRECYTEFEVVRQ